jgi:hypothetical protein
MLNTPRFSSPSFSAKGSTFSARIRCSSLTKSALLAAMAVGALAAGQSQALTISIYNSFNFGGSGYRTYLADQLIPWTTAYNYATGLGGTWNLVSINNEAENAAIFNQIDTASLWSGIVGPYIGLFQPNGNTEPAGGWRWVDGTLASYTNWHPVEPNNGAICSNVTGVNNCDSVGGFIYRSLGGIWYDASIGPTTFTVNGFPVSNPGNLREANLSYSFVVEGPPEVPGPLPILGALAAFGTSRKLRKRIKATKAVGASITAG